MSGIYIHIPFCKQACHYCDFHFSTAMGKKEAMLDALCKELELRKYELKEEWVETIYFGGGTPSVLRIEEINRLIATVYEHYRVIQFPEITLEANPDDLTKGKIKELNESSINRLSIGIQSFFDEDLTLMNRAHSAAEAEACMVEALKYFANCSIDLIYGIPGMDNRRWRRNIEKAIAYHVPHVSAYALTVEPKTALAHLIKKGAIAPVEDALAQAHFALLLTEMERSGFVNYEISNFGKPGFFSRNNTAYWQQKKYIGIGPSAHSYDGLHRGWNVGNNPKYIKALQHHKIPIERETLSVTDRYNEYIMTGLRTIWGVSLAKIREEFGQDHLEYLEKQAARHLAGHLLCYEGDRLRTTQKGRFLIDGIAADMFLVNL